jgi:UPF0271 protein
LTRKHLPETRRIFKLKTIDLNCDIGEGFGAYKLGMDAEVMPHISSANIACGWHAGDPMIMNSTVALAALNKTGCGAHPGYPDLLGFGRRAMAVEAEVLKHYIAYQVGALDAFCRVNNAPLRHVKPHGSLYHAILDDEETAAAVIDAICRINSKLIYVTLAGRKGDAVAEIGRSSGLAVAREAFPDRAYTAEGTLAPRNQPGAVIKEPQQVVERALQMATEGKVISIEGHAIDLRADTLCVHGDNPGAVQMVKEIRRLLQAANVSVLPMLSTGSQEAR